MLFNILWTGSKGIFRYIFCVWDIYVPFYDSAGFFNFMDFMVFFTKKVQIGGIIKLFVNSSLSPPVSVKWKI